MHRLTEIDQNSFQTNCNPEDDDESSCVPEDEDWLTECGPDYGTDCMPECGPDDGS